VYAPRNPPPEYTWDFAPQSEELSFPETLTLEDDAIFPNDVPFRFPGCPYLQPTPLKLAPRLSSPALVPSFMPAASAKPKSTPKSTPKPTPKTKSTPKHTLSTFTPRRSGPRADSHSPSVTAVTRRRRLTYLPAQPILEWDDAALLSLWQWKIVKKKGFGPMLRFFPGQTEDSLREVWEEKRDYCRELGVRWEEMGRERGVR
jgi:hypothetical protein